MKHKDQEYLAEQIRSQYTEPQHTELDALKALDRKVKRPAHLFAGTFGTLSALVLGAGMSLIMTDIGQTVGLADPMRPGLIVGILGLVMAVLTYPMYKTLLNARRRQYADQIIAMSDPFVQS